MRQRAAYCAPKFGLIRLIQVLAAEGRAPPGYAPGCCIPGQWTPAGDVGAGRSGRRKSGSAAVRARLAEHVVRLIVWIAEAPPDLVLDAGDRHPLPGSGGHDGNPTSLPQATGVAVRPT